MLGLSYLYVKDAHHQSVVWDDRGDTACHPTVNSILISAAHGAAAAASGSS